MRLCARTWLSLATLFLLNCGHVSISLVSGNSCRTLSFVIRQLPARFVQPKALTVLPCCDMTSYAQQNYIISRCGLKSSTSRTHLRWRHFRMAMTDGDPSDRLRGSGAEQQVQQEHNGARVKGESGWLRRQKDKLSNVNKMPIFGTKFDSEIIAMAIPSYTAVMLDPVATIIDVSFIGRLPESTLSLGGVGISNTILNYFGFTFFFIVVTTTTTLAQTLAQAAIVRATSTFRAIDNDGSGGIDLNEMRTAVKTDQAIFGAYYSQTNGAQIKSLFDKIDANRDGTITLSEFQDYLARSASGECPELNITHSMSALAREKEGGVAAEQECGGGGCFDIQAVSEEGQAAGSRVIAGAMLVATGMGLVSAATSWVLAPQLVYLVAGSSEAALVPYAISYMRAKCLGIPAMILFFSIIGAYRGYRDLTTPLLGNFLSSACKIAFGYVFLFQLNMGVGGAGLADALARYCSCAVMIWLLVGSKRLRPVDLLTPPSKQLFLDLMAPAGALTIRKIIEQLCFTASIRLSASYGAAAVASAEVVRQIWSLLSTLWWPLSVAAQTLVAGILAEWAATRTSVSSVANSGNLEFLHRARLWRKARFISVRMMGLSTLIGLVGGLSVYSGRFLIPPLMTTNAVVQECCTHQLPVVALIMPISALCDMTEAVLIAAKCYDVVLKGMAIGGVFLFAALWLGSRQGLGVATVWLALGVLFGVRVVMCLAVFDTDTRLPPPSSRL